METMPKILVVQGANMNWLGKRQPEHYGSTSAAELDAMIRRHAEAKGYEVDIFYTNTEGAAIDRIYQAVEAGVDALVMNPAGFTFNGYALADTVRSTRIPYVEVHVSNLYARYPKEMTSIPGPTAQCVIMGLGVQGYILGLEAALHLISQKAG